MNQRFRRIREIFDAAVERPEAARRAFVDEACQGDGDLRAELEALLVAHRQCASSVNESGTRGSTETEVWSVPEGASSLAPPYRLLQKIGEGGMGEVWLAEQREPLRRRVALKIIKKGMDTAQVVARFEAERQALALMDHAHVAKVFDAGSTEAGRPYFVMEYVAGVPITQHCDQQKLGIRERLELFRMVCKGVQHAHQKAIIHRDLKPSNVLVSMQDGKPVPKIIDFGIAKAIAHRLTERTLYTELGVLIGTPEYMSPEQASLSGQDVDTRTDVYSLGVMLYELLVGALPFESNELRGMGLDGIRRAIREIEPRKPSSRLGKLGAERSARSAERRRLDTRSLRRRLAGDLDGITMRALEKDMARRYASVSEFEADIGRHLADQPVFASPPSAVYRARKFVRRHRLGVAATVVVTLGLVGFAATTTAQAKRIAREMETKERVTQFLTELFEIADPSEARGATVTARELLEKGAQRIESSLTEEPEVQAELMATMARVCLSLGLYKQAGPLAEKALQTQRRILGAGHPQTVPVMTDLAYIYSRQVRWADAANMAREAFEIRRRTLGPEHPDTLASMGDRAFFGANEGLLREAVDVQTRALGREHPVTLRSMHNLAILRSNAGDYAEAEALLQEVVPRRKRVLGVDHVDTLKSMSNLAMYYGTQGRHSQAEQLLLETVEIQKRVLGPENPSTLNSMNNLAVTYSALRRHAEAEALLRQLLEIQKRVMGPEQPETLWSMSNLANALSGQGRRAEATVLFREVLEIQKRVLGPEHPETLSCMARLASVRFDDGRRAEGEALMREALRIQRRVMPEHPDTAEMVYTLALMAASQGKRREALGHLREATQRGFSDLERLQGAAAFAALRDSQEFSDILRAARQNRDGRPVTDGSLARGGSPPAQKR